jgi:RNA polymerase sigma-70 factor (ECF subfamily)
MDETDFTEFYRTTRAGVVDGVSRVVTRRAVAEDAVADAFTKALDRWPRIRTMRSPSGWVYRVAVNAARRQLARESREAERLAAAMVDRSPSPDPQADLWLLVEDLPPRQRTAVVLRHLGGRTEVEIAEAMGVTRGTVSSTLTAAHARLAALLTTDDPNDEEPQMELTLALAGACDETGCDVEHLDDGRRRRTRWSDAVRDTIRVRPGDLVAVADGEVVWRWWGGTVVSVDGEDVIVSRNVAQREPGDPRTATFAARSPEDLALQVGDQVWFGRDGDLAVIVAAGTPRAILDRAAARLAEVDAALGSRP